KQAHAGPLGLIKPKIKEVIYASNVFEIPDDMNFMEVCMLASYLKDNRLQDVQDIADNFQRIAKKFARLGFKKCSGTFEQGTSVYCDYCKWRSEIKNEEIINRIDDVIDLITIKDGTGKIQTTPVAQRQFEWEVQGVTEDEFNNLCQKVLSSQSKKIEEDGEMVL
ncbi:MAG: hypothetical protein IJS68_03130, partial [Clostridia bacterium]|nr:hypothetical protein [Clostridia bacterium]